jgi:hypothetical protein
LVDNNHARFGPSATKRLARNRFAGRLLGSRKTRIALAVPTFAAVKKMVGQGKTLDPAPGPIFLPNAIAYR